MCSDGVWLTTTELYERYGIPPKRTLSMAPDLEAQGLARRTGECNPGPGSNPWLFNPAVVGVLLPRRSPGRPRKYPTPQQVARMGLMKGDSIEAVRRRLGVGWRVAKRWLKELGLR